jgi:hypothetical protein
MSTLIIGGIRYKLCTPKDESELRSLLRKCSKEIFGEGSVYFDVKYTLKALSGISFIPDAYVVGLSRSELCILENEMSSHSAYNHIVK